MPYATRRAYAGASATCTLAATIASDASTASLTGTVSAWPDTANGPFFMVIDPGLATEEKVLVGSRSGTSLSSITRNVDGTQASGHSTGAVCYPVFTAVDADQANKIVSTLTTKGDLLVTDGSVLNRLAVGTAKHVLVATTGATNGVSWTQIDADGIATNAVTSDKILSGAVNSDKIANATIVQGDLAVAFLEALCPVGTISAYPGGTAPTGWILCNGTAVVLGTHPKLYALCATTPDLRGRTLVGVGTGAGLTARTLNATGGAETHTLTEAELAIHTHANGLTNSTVTTANITSTSHSHGINDDRSFWGENATLDWGLANGADRYFKVGNTFDRTSDAASVDHTHTITTGVTIQNAAIGSGTAHNNMQPFYALNYIIKHDYV